MAFPLISISFSMVQPVYRNEALFAGQWRYTHYGSEQDMPVR
jgi:hypothetical protein